MSGRGGHSNFLLLLLSKFPIYNLKSKLLVEHQGLQDRTTAEVSGIKIEGKNKWMTLIQNARYQIHKKES
jgi:hypothetical protein